MVSPTTFLPSRCSIPATTELSTPPDIATAIVRAEASGIRWCQLSQARDAVDHCVDQQIDLLGCVRSPDRKSETRLRLLFGQTDRHEHMRWFRGSTRARRTGRNRETDKVKR